MIQLNGFISSEINGIPMFKKDENVKSSTEERILEKKYKEFYPNFSKQNVRETYFFLDSKYEWGKGWNNEKEKEEFQKEIILNFSNAGWDLELPRKGSGSAIVGRKGYFSLYFHPMEISGEIYENMIPEIAETIRKISPEIAKLREIRVLDKRYCFKSQDIVEFMTKNRNYFYWWIILAFQKKVSQFEKDYTILSVKDKVGNFFKQSCPNLQNEWIAEAMLMTFFQNLVDVGDIKETKKETKNGITLYYKSKTKNWKLVNYPT